MTLFSLSLHAGFLSNVGMKKVYYPQVYLDKEEAKKQLQPGSSSIRGVAFYADPMGTGTYYAKNTTVMLIPYTEYFHEWMSLNKKFLNTEHEVYLNPDAVSINRLMTTDQYGNFYFDRLKPGKYYLEAIVNYRSSSVGSTQTGTAFAAGPGYAYATPIYQYYTYMYDAQKKAMQVVEIEKNGESVNVKLRPSGPSILNLDALFSNHKSTLCYLQANLWYGTCKEFHPNGSTKVIADWDDNYYDGEYKEYDPQGNLIKSGEYEDGYEIGDWYYYEKKSKTPTKKEHYKRINDRVVLDGDIELYYSNGKVVEEQHYKEGKLDGKMRAYHPNGELQEEGEFKDGLREGVFSFYDQNGKLTHTIEYLHGKIISPAKQTKK